MASVASAQTTTLGQTYGATVTSATAPTGTLTAGSLIINGVQVGATASDGVSFSNSTFSAIAEATAINSADIPGVIATANATTVTAAGALTAGGGPLAAGDLVINGVNIIGSVVTEANALGLINAQTALTGVTAADSTTTPGTIELTAADGRNITVTATAAGTTATGFATGANVTTEGKVTLTSNNTTAATAGIDITSAGLSGFTAATTAATLASGTVSNANVLTVASSNQALNTVDAALQTIAATGAQLGAYQDRFQAAVTGINTTSTNLQSARSTVQDTDYAQATSELSKAQILQQASTAMVAQANTIPQNVLTLLQKLP
ncbi:MAG: flagellin [Trebonia sp.]